MREQPRQTQTRANMPVANTTTTTVTGLLTEQEQRENLEALVEAAREYERKIEEGTVKVRPARPVETQI